MVTEPGIRDLAGPWVTGIPEISSRVPGGVGEWLLRGSRSVFWVRRKGLAATPELSTGDSQDPISEPPFLSWAL